MTNSDQNIKSKGKMQNKSLAKNGPLTQFEVGSDALEE